MANLAYTATQLPFTLFDLIVSLGIIQGIIIAFVLYFIPAKGLGKTLFCLALLIFALLSFKILLHTLGLWNALFFRYFPLAIDITLQPLLFLYNVSITGAKVSNGRKVLFFVPTIVFMLYALVVYALALSKQTFYLKMPLQMTCISIKPLIIHALETEKLYLNPELSNLGIQ